MHFDLSEKKGINASKLNLIVSKSLSELLITIAEDIALQSLLILYKFYWVGNCVQHVGQL